LLLWIPLNAIQYATVISVQNDTKIEKMKPKCATKQSSQIKSNRICSVSIYYQCADYIWVRLMCRVIYDEKDVGRAEVLIDTEPEIIVV